MDATVISGILEIVPGRQFQVSFVLPDKIEGSEFRISVLGLGLRIPCSSSVISAHGGELQGGVEV